MKTTLKIFIIHLIVVLLTVVFVTCIAFSSGPNGNINDEACLVWAAFLLFDFPCSIIVMVTSGPGVVGVPEFVRGGGFFVSEILWPGMVFQVVGTINWVLIMMLYRRIVGSPAQPEDNNGYPHPNPPPRAGEGSAKQPY